MLGLGTVHWDSVLYDNVTDAAVFNILGTLKTHAQVLTRFQQSILPIHFAHLALVAFPQVLEGRGKGRGRGVATETVYGRVAGACNGMANAIY